MSELSSTSKKLIILTVAICFISLLPAFLYYKGNIEGLVPFVFGLFIGAAFSCVKVVWTERSLIKASEMPEGRGRNYERLGFVYRHLAAIAVIVICAIPITPINFIGTAIGMVVLQISAYIVPLISKLDKRL